MRRAAIAILAACAALASCGYHVAGRADMMPKTVHSIAIPAFGNATTRYKLSDRIPEAIAREFIARTRYKVVTDESQADAVLRGSIVNYYSGPIVVANGRSTVVQISVTMSATLTERATGKVLFSRPSFDMKQQYEISTDQLAFFEESDTAMTRLSHEAARMIVSAVLEKF